MKVYAFDLMPWPDLAEPSHYPDSNALFDPVRGQQIYAEHLDQMVLCEEYGFDAVCINEHHAKPYGLMPSPNIVAAALTQRTRRITIGILGNLPALHAHPVRLAEEIAMLDVMSGGRIISGFVRGVPQEYLAFSVPLAESRERLQEAWDARRQGVDRAGALRVAREVLQLRPRLDLAAPSPAAASADRAPRGQRRRAWSWRPAAAWGRAPPIDPTPGRGRSSSDTARAPPGTAGLPLPSTAT